MHLWALTFVFAVLACFGSGVAALPSRADTIRTDSSATVYGRVYYHDQTPNYRFVETNQTNVTNAVAWGSYDPTLNTTGWSVLRIFTNKKFSDQQQVHAAGYLEGCLTYAAIFDHYSNFFADFLIRFPGHGNGTEAFEVDEVGGGPGRVPQEQWPAILLQWVENNRAYVYNRTGNPSDPFWRHISFLLEQFAGMVDGYNDRVEAAMSADEESRVGPLRGYRHLSEVDFWILQMLVDVDAVMISLLPKNEWPPEFDATYCSAQSQATVAVVLLSGYSDVYFAHGSWKPYVLMNRVFKFFHLDLRDIDMRTRILIFSSYPGLAFSADDFYMTDFGFAVAKAPHCVWNFTVLAQTVIPSSLLPWLRVPVAIRLASSGMSLASNLAKLAGSELSEWILMDMNCFEQQHQPPSSGFLTLLELAPGGAVTTDWTANLLEERYFFAANIPRTKEHYDMLGFPKMQEKYGEQLFGFKNYSLLEIFDRNVSSLGNFDSFRRLMRYNAYDVDPLSFGDPALALCGREDLRNASVVGIGPALFGCIDTKAIRGSDLRALILMAVSGPAFSDSPALPRFDFRKWPSSGVPHGLPFVWDFDWFKYKTDMPEDVCPSRAACGSCVDQYLCGWCDGRCVAGDSFGPFEGNGGCDEWELLLCVERENWTWLTVTVMCLLGCVMFGSLVLSFIGLVAYNVLAVVRAHRARKRRERVLSTYTRLEDGVVNEN